jgi:hypothetical protein
VSVRQGAEHARGDEREQHDNDPALESSGGHRGSLWSSAGRVANPRPGAPLATCRSRSTRTGLTFLPSPTSLRPSTPEALWTRQNRAAP